jgi:APA family basic amino acid/polyamine antiporter
MAASVQRLGTSSGVGLVIANMIGAGVFLSTGFMAQDLGPALIMLAWLIGAVIALAGARAYAELAVILPRSGGEYRFLSELMHPALGYLAGWASLLIGFSAPIAIDALAAGAFLETLAPQTNGQATGVAILVTLTLFHAAGFRSSVLTQNSLIAVKLLLIVGFIILGLGVGSTDWPTWEPLQQSSAFPLTAFASGLFYIAFAFSGWNAAVYVAEEFREPGRQVPRALLIGCGSVAILYLLVNFVLVANVTPRQAQVVFDYETTRVTLGHVVTRELLGPAGGAAMSVLTIIAFVSAMSAMMMVGPRVYAAMAHDGFLPRLFAGSGNGPPRAPILLQGAVALVIVGTHSLQTVLQNAGAVLAFFSGLTVLSLFAVRFVHTQLPRPRRAALIAAGVHGASAFAMFGFGVMTSWRLVVWMGVTSVVALVAYRATAIKRRAVSAVVD